MWTGLMNLDGVECLDDACINQLTWLSDGSAFTTRHSTDKIDMKSTSDQQPCTVFKTDHSTADKNCRDQKYFTCQFSCNAGTYGNCRLLLFSYNRMLKIFKYRKMSNDLGSRWHCTTSWLHVLSAHWQILSAWLCPQELAWFTATMQCGRSHPDGVQDTSRARGPESHVP